MARFSRARDRACATIVCLFFVAPLASGGEITIDRGPTATTVPLPFFDTSLGILTGIEIDFNLAAGTTGSAGAHTHTLDSILHTGGTTGAAGAHNHTVTLPIYSGGGLMTVPASVFSTASAGSHTHTVGVGATTTSSSGSHSHTYGAHSRTIFFASDSQIAAFLGGEDFSLSPQGPTVTSQGPAHTHTFGIGVIGVSNVSGVAHTVAPSWSTSTRFIYDPFSGSPDTYEWDAEAAPNNLWSNAANWLDSGGLDGVPDGNDILSFTDTSADGPQVIDVGGGARQIHRIVANGVDTNFGPYIVTNGTLEIFLTAGNAILSDSGGGSLEFFTDIRFYIPNAPLRFNVSAGGGPIVVHGNVAPSSTTGTTELVLTSRNLELDSSVTVDGNISDGPGSTLELTVGFGPDSENHRGTVTVTGDNTYSGKTVVNGATLVFDSIRNVGDVNPNALGMPTPENAAISLGANDSSSGVKVPGTLRYIGDGDSTNRPLFLSDGGGAVIESSGSGPLVFTAPQMTVAAGGKTLTLGGTNTGANEIAGDIPDAASPGQGSGGEPDNLVVEKTGSGNWILSGNNAYTGGTVNHEGRLTVTDTALPAASGVVNNGELEFRFPLEAGPNPSYSGVISGTGGLIKSDSGRLILSETNTYTGNTTISSGQLIVNTVADAGVPSGIGAGDTVSLTGDFASLIYTGATTSFNRNIILSQLANQPRIASTSALLTVEGIISGSDEFRFFDVLGMIELTGTNTYIATTLIQSGSTLSVPAVTNAGVAGPLGAGNRVRFGPNAKFVYTGSNGSTDREFENIGGSAFTATIDVVGGELVLNGLITNGDPSNTLIKQGAGTLIVTRNNSYESDTTVAAGTLLANNTAGSGTGSGGESNFSATGQGNVTVAAGATLGGTGSIFGSVTVQNDGRIDPGVDTGTLTVGSAMFSSGGELLIEIAGTGQGEFDQLLVTGDATLDGVLDISLIAPFTPTPGQSFKIIDVGGSLSGIFSGLPQAALVGSFGGTNLFINYNAGDGNDVALFASADLPGDYNGNGVVDAADYTVWRDHLGQSITLPNEDPGTTPGLVTQEDYNFWKANFGATAGGGSAGALPSQSPVPEPATMLPAMIGAVALCVRRRGG